MEAFLAFLQSLKPDTDFLSSDNLVEDGVLDSLDIFDIIEAAESKYGIVIDGEDVDPDHFVTPHAMWQMIEKYL